jgi:TadE-like protein
MVEFALSSVVLLLLVGGLVDIGRALYVSETLSSAAREGARHAVWFDAGRRSHPYLSDTQIQSSVDAALTASGLPASVLKNSVTPCPAPTDGNGLHNPPYANSAYPAATNQPWLYICYDNSAVVDFPGAPPTSGQTLQDVNVIVLYSYGALTPIVTAQFGSFRLAVNQHMTVQGP